MAPDILTGMDEARGESKTVFCVMDKTTGEVKPLHFSDKPITLKEIKSVLDRLLGASASWTAEIRMTHKEIREYKKWRREYVPPKARLPRKKKKAFKKWVVQQSLDMVRVWSSLEWPDVQPMIDYYEKKLFEAASVKLQEDIQRHMGTSGNTLEESIKTFK